MKTKRTEKIFDLTILKSRDGRKLETQQIEKLSEGQGGPAWKDGEANGLADAVDGKVRSPTDPMFWVTSGDRNDFKMGYCYGFASIRGYMPQI